MASIPYLFVTFLCLFLAEVKLKNVYIFRFLAIITLILFIGLRYDVGADYLSYEKMFHNIQQTPITNLFVEPGYFILNKFVLLFSNQFFLLTTLIISIQLFFVHKSLKNFKYYTFALLVFICLNLGSIVNEMRQYLAVCIFLYSLKFIIDKSFIKYLLFVLFASLFHYSAILMLPLYFFLRKKMSPYFYPLIFLIILPLSISGVFDKLFNHLIELTPYSFYLERDEAEKVNVASGLGFMLLNLLGFTVLCFSKYIIKEYPQYLIYLNLFLVFLVTRNLFFNIGILMRLVLYFQISQIFIYPLFIYTVFKSKIRIEMMIALSIVFLLLFISGVLNYSNHLTYQTILK